MIPWLGDKVWIRHLLQKRLGLPPSRILFSEHHLSHAASAFYASPFPEAAILTVDGVGEWTTATIGVGRGTELTLLEEIRFPHSLGLLYSAFTAFLGFEVNEGEYKVMGMAPFGAPRHVDRVWKLIRAADDGGFELDMSYFEFHRSTERTYSDRFVELFGAPRDPVGAVLHGRQRVPVVLRPPRPGPRGAGGAEPVLRRPRGEHPGGHRGDGAPDGAVCAPPDGPVAPLHGRRRRAQQRGQRSHPPRRPVRGGVRPARGGRFGRRARARRSGATTRYSAARGDS